METFTAIFTQLGVDSSLVPQFIIILVVFTLAQFLFLGKLQNVLQTREEKTVKLESNADETIEKVQKMQSEYKSKIEEASRSALKTANEKKQKIIQKYTDQYKETEKQTNSYVDQSRNEFLRDVEINKEKYLSEAESLAHSLVQKMIQ
jgi:F0F1-type ATP synthase membrane subunit b/b'